MESPRASGPARRSPATVLTAPASHRRRARAGSEVPLALRNGALVAGGVLTATGRGDLWTIAVALGFADASVLTGAVVAAAAVATLARTGSAALADIAGAQAVLGAAGFTGSGIAIASAWATALGLVTVARNRIVGGALGLVAAAVVAGPSLAGGTDSVVTAAAAAVSGIAVGVVVTPRAHTRPWQQFVAAALAAVGVALGVVAGYH